MKQTSRPDLPTTPLRDRPLWPVAGFTPVGTPQSATYHVAARYPAPADVKCQNEIVHAANGTAHWKTTLSATTPEGIAWLLEGAERARAEGIEVEIAVLSRNEIEHHGAWPGCGCGSHGFTPAE